MMSKRVTLQSFFIAAYSAILLMLMILPRYQYRGIYVEIALLSVPFLFIYTFCRKRVLQKTWWMFLGLVLIALFRFVWNTFLDFNAAINLSLILYLCLIPYFIFEALQSRNNRLEAIAVICITVLLLGVIGFNTLREFSVDPTVARLLAKGINDDDYINFLRNSNIGGFGFSYSIGMLTPYTAMRITKAKGKKKILPIIVLIVLFVYIYYSQYTTLLLLSFFFTAIVFIVKARDRALKSVLIIMLLALLLNMRSIFFYLSSHLSLETLALHFEDLYNLMSGKGSESSRQELYKNAFVLFLRYPLFGANLKDPSNAYIANHAHSTFFGLLVNGGIVGTGLYYGVLGIAIRNIKHALGSIRDIQPVFIMFFVLGIINPAISFEITAVVFMLIPLLELIHIRRGDQNELP